MEMSAKQGKYSVFLLINYVVEKYQLPERDFRDTKGGAIGNEQTKFLANTTYVPNRNYRAPLGADLGTQSQLK